MTRSRPGAAALSGSADDIETAFYEALQHDDTEMMGSDWAQNEDIFCVHPGRPRLWGAHSIHFEFESMFSHGVVRATSMQALRVGAQGCAMHSVVEKLRVLLPEGVRQAVEMVTNGYRKAPEGWRMMAHSASPGAARHTQPLGTLRPMLC